MPSTIATPTAVAHAMTPGPWHFEKAPNGYVYIRAADTSIVAVIYGTNALADGTCEGNAAAIALLPELLRRAVDVVEGVEDLALPGALPSRVQKLRRAVVQAGALHA